jgi:hypothetical protein
VRLNVPRSTPAGAQLRLILDGEPLEISASNNLARPLP